MDHHQPHIWGDNPLHLHKNKQMDIQVKLISLFIILLYIYIGKMCLLIRHMSLGGIQFIY